MNNGKPTTTPQAVKASKPHSAAFGSFQTVLFAFLRGKSDSAGDYIAKLDIKLIANQPLPHGQR
jgi:hypothetical protein